MFYRYVLEKYNGPSSRYVCPNCGHKEFVRYIDRITGQHLHPDVGRCNREVKCGYHYTPRKYFENMNAFNKPQKEVRQMDKPNEVEPSYIDKAIFEKTLLEPHKNSLVQFLCSVFEPKEVMAAVELYCVGTSSLWEGAVIFWQIDIANNIRGGKIIAYDPATGKRIKDKITWVHTHLKLPGFNLKQCLFGEHLLRTNDKEVAIVESEKTALICHIVCPRFLWLATGGKSNLSVEKMKVLKGRNVVLVPDLGGFEAWSKKAIEIQKELNLSIRVYNGLEELASKEDKEQGLDIADYFIRKAKEERIQINSTGVVRRPDDRLSRLLRQKEVVERISKLIPQEKKNTDFLKTYYPVEYLKVEEARMELYHSFGKPRPAFDDALRHFELVWTEAVPLFYGKPSGTHNGTPEKDQQKGDAHTVQSFMFEISPGH